MKKHLLIDLDGTLLENDMDVFGPAYYRLLGSHLSKWIVPDLMIKYLLSGTNAMINNLDPKKTLENVFDEIFYPGIGVEKRTIINHIHEFYREKFPRLKELTKPIPDAIQLVKNAQKQGYKVSIATNPLFPRTAILQRLFWAELSPDEYQFTLIPSYESFHHAKPNPEYYLEFIQQLNAMPEECVMVGNDIEADIIPSSQIGIPAFHISNYSDHLNENRWRSGKLKDVIPWLATI